MYKEHDYFQDFKIDAYVKAVFQACPFEYFWDLKAGIVSNSNLNDLHKSKTLSVEKKHEKGQLRFGTTCQLIIRQALLINDSSFLDSF